MSEITPHELKILREIAGLEPASRWGAWVGECLEWLKGSGYITSTFSGQPTKKGLLTLLQSGPILLHRWDWPSARELEAEGKIVLTPGDCPNTRTASLKPGVLPMSQHPSAPIVGAFFRPPAKAILAVLPADCPLHLEPEPTNAHDPNAIAVMIESRDIPATSRPALEETCPPMGFSADDIFEAPGWHLGYIKRDFAEELAPAFEQLIGARLGFDPAGKPLAILEWKPS